jgi:dethiobiotin synthetase
MGNEGARSPLVVVTGTGTEIGKTHVASALLRAWGGSARVVGYKPVETGVEPGTEGADAIALREASTFHVEHPLRRSTFREPLSPHLAARHEGRTLHVDDLVEQARALREQAEGVVVELAGGLFTPLAADLFNADLARALEPTAILLVAPDRLGVLHDVAATSRAARHAGLTLEAVVLSAPSHSDLSTGTNALELHDIVGIRVLATFPRAEGDDARTQEASRGLLEALRLG